MGTLRFVSIASKVYLRGPPYVFFKDLTKFSKRVHLQQDMIGLHSINFVILHKWYASMAFETWKDGH